MLKLHRMKSPRTSHTHLQFAQADTQPKIAKEYVLPPLQTKRKRKHIPPTKCISHWAISSKNENYRYK